MENRSFSSSQLKVLLHPEHWKLFFRNYVEELSPLPNNKHRHWSAQHGHKHPYRELLIPLRGNTVVGIDGLVYPCQPGTFFYFDTHQDHDNNYPDSSSDLEHIWIGFVPEHIFVNLFMMKNGVRSSRKITDLSLKMPGFPDLSKPVDSIWPNFNSYSPDFRRMKLLTAFTQLITVILDHTFATPEPGEKDLLQKRAVEKICAHIRNCGGNGVNLDNLSRISGYSKYHFHRLFKSITGMSIHQYIDFCRKEITVDLLDQGLSKKEICYRLGFSSPSAFSRWQKAAFKS